MVLFRAVVFLALLVTCWATAPNPNRGTTDAVYALLERTLKGSSPSFELTIDPALPCTGATGLCFVMTDSSRPNGGISIAATSASELTAALGIYFREYCNFTIGWPRGGGNHVFHPPAGWPKVGSVSRSRIVPWSYIMNVCTHSYSLVWYTMQDWTRYVFLSHLIFSKLFFTSDSPFLDWQLH